jgi:DNA repair protein SbcD/Mre11
MSNAAGRANAMEIFATLDVPGVTVAGRPSLYVIDTPGGKIQIAALPWLRRGTLLTREDAKNLTIEEINRKLQSTLTNIIEGYTGQLDPSLPAILTAHVWVTGATPGSERMMTIGQEHTLLLSSVANPAFDYVALGHIHKRQVLNENPPVIYSGSMERVDFGEEGDDKGYYIVDITGAGGERKTEYRFQPVQARRFLTLDVKLEETELDPTATILQAVAAKKTESKESIVRLNISLPSALEGQLRDTDIREALKEADYLAVTLERQRTPRTRGIPGADTAGELSPLPALEAWLEQQPDMTEPRRRELLEYGEKLIQET